MIILHVYLTPKPGKERDLETGIRDRWLAAMAQQPGFLASAAVTPFDDAALRKLGAKKPEHRFEILSFWRSEEERLAWVARPIHNQVFLPLLELTSSVSSTLQNVWYSNRLPT